MHTTNIFVDDTKRVTIVKGVSLPNVVEIKWEHPAIYRFFSFRTENAIDFSKALCFPLCPIPLNNGKLNDTR